MDDVDGVRETFEALRALGVSIAIDDFGTGFSSLATLADLPSTCSSSTARSSTRWSTRRRTRRSSAASSRSPSAMGLPVVAEGVETAEQLEALRSLGCRWAQGYHLGRPAPLPRG